MTCLCQFLGNNMFENMFFVQACFLVIFYRVLSRHFDAWGSEIEVFVMKELQKLTFHRNRFLSLLGPICIAFRSFGSNLSGFRCPPVTCLIGRVGAPPILPKRSKPKKSWHPLGLPGAHLGVTISRLPRCCSRKQGLSGL